MRSMRRMLSFTVCSVVLGAALVAPAADSPVGRWKTVDDKTGKALSEVELYDQGGKLHGKIRDLSASDGRYKGGTILDPEDGKVYKAEIWVEGGALKVRGYLGMFYKTQTWQKSA